MNTFDMTHSNVIYNNYAVGCNSYSYECFDDEEESIQLANMKESLKHWFKANKFTIISIASIITFMGLFGMFLFGLFC